MLELLVVIAVIALLAALLMPSLSRARERGRRVICISNLRQWGIVAMNFSIDDGKDRFPVVHDANGGGAYGTVAGLMHWNSAQVWWGEWAMTEAFFVQTFRCVSSVPASRIRERLAGTLALQATRTLRKQFQAFMNHAR